MTPLIRTVGAVLALGLLLAACGGKRGTVQGGNDTFTATTLTVYTDLPLQGPDFSRQLSIANGAALALYRAGGHVGPLHVSFVLLNDAGRLVFPTHAYRDNRTQAGLAALAKNGADRLYAATGIPNVFYNTSLQLADIAFDSKTLRVIAEAQGTMNVFVTALPGL